ncbi:nuclear RNA export factor 3 [Rhinolophus ferrumequinum]|uniref:Nuclear RNA export factor 3 n=1 Tax=Rhinolophus ferrumequinum TaxID=59479 RepID=A0A7J8AWB2_RHIFE|nr:nuclear RNA export factor 3 [Rhinolophus ferrumequinum]
MGHNTQDNTLQRRPRGRTMYQRRYNYVSEHVRSGIHFSSHQQQDGDTATTGIHMGTGIRYAPYTIPCYYQRENFKKRDQTRANMEKEQKPPERMEEKQDETSGSWFKVIIPFGIRYDEKWLLNLIQKQCSVPFTPVEFHYEKMQAQFFVEDASIAFALKTVNGKIWDEDNEKISVIINRSDAPHSVQKELKSEKAEMIKLTMNKQCGVSPDSLDIQRLCFDPDWMTCDTETAPNPRICMAASLQIDEGNMPKVKSAGQLAKGKGLWPEEMSANRNSLCTTIPDKSTNISSILELFPKLLCLDGQEPLPPTNFGIEAHKKLPTCKGSSFGSDVLKSLVLQFLQQYYLIYDSGVRQGLLGAYHDEACFSLTVLFNPTDQAPSSLFEYFKDNRNMKNLKDPYLRVQLLKHTKRDIVCSLCVLPKTQHDLLSFVVDMWFQTERMLCFSVNGVFKEVEGKSQGSVHAFTRTFIAIPASSSGLCIVNEELFVRDAIPDEIQSLHLPSDFAYPPSAPYPHCHRSSRKCWRLSPPHLG